MIYAIGFRDYSVELGHRIIIQEHITKEEYDSHNAALGEAHKISAMDNVYNYLSAVSMFIDYGERYNSKNFGKERMKKFQKKTNDFYDSHISYRFIALMRNYALHYGFPLSVIRSSEIGPSGIFASKEALLKFKSWKHALEDIKKMPELISLDIHVEISMMFIKHLYQDYIYEIAPVVLKGIEYLNNMIKKSGGKMPILATFKSVEEFKQGNISVSIIDIKSYHDALEIIKSHPSIDIIVK